MNQNIIASISDNSEGVRYRPQDICKCLYMSIRRMLKCDYLKKYVHNHQPVKIPQQAEHHYGKKTLIIDLDETLVHSSFTYMADSDFVLKIRVGKMKYTIHVRVRPGCEEFLKAMSEYYEIFIFTASVPEYANPVIDKIDPQRYCHLRLFRSNCSLVNGMFVKDLSKVGRNLHNVIIIDNSKSSFALQPNNAIHIKNFINDPTDNELLDLIPFLKLVNQFDDVRPIEETLKKYNRYETISFTNNGERKIYDRREDQIYDDNDSINQTMDLSKDETSFLNSNKQNIKLQTKFSIEEDEYAAEMQYRDEQGLNSPNSHKDDDDEEGL